MCAFEMVQRRTACILNQASCPMRSQEQWHPRLSDLRGCECSRRQKRLPWGGFACVLATLVDRASELLVTGANDY